MQCLIGEQAEQEALFQLREGPAVPKDLCRGSGGVPSSDRSKEKPPELPRLLSSSSFPSVTEVERGQEEPVRGNMGPLCWSEIRNKEKKRMVGVVPLKV